MSATSPLADPARSDAPSLWERLGSLMSRRYREPLLDFVSRLLEEDGIAYYFKVSGDKEVLVLVDQSSGDPDSAFPEAEIIDPDASAMVPIILDRPDLADRDSLRYFDWIQPLLETLKCERWSCNSRQICICCVIICSLLQKPLSFCSVGQNMPWRLGFVLDGVWIKRRNTGKPWSVTCSKFKNHKGNGYCWSIVMNGLVSLNFGPRVVLRRVTCLM